LTYSSWLEAQKKLQEWLRAQGLCASGQVVSKREAKTQKKKNHREFEEKQKTTEKKPNLDNDLSSRFLFNRFALSFGRA
jgi:hypothetical protein